MMRFYTLFTIIAILGMTNPAWAKTCYPASYDSDGDGYAVDSAPGESKDVGKKLHCPSGYVDRKGDCDDNNRSIHPRTIENTTNFVDDDCDGKTDEPKSLYPPNIWSYTSTYGFWVRYEMTATIRLCAELWDNVYVTPYVKDWDYDLGFVAGTREHVPASDIQSDGLYEKWIQTNWAGNGFEAYLTFDCDGLDYSIEGQRWYAYTDPDTNQQNNVQWAQYWIINSAMKELMDSQDGKVGYRGSVNVDGTRYGASANEKWCSEFYSWNANKKLTIGNRGTVGDIKWYFLIQYGGFFEEPPGVPVEHASYVPVGDNTHSTMSVEYDWKNAKMHTIEGNVNNEVVAKHRPFSDADGEGYIIGDMIRRYE